MCAARLARTTILLSHEPIRQMPSSRSRRRTLDIATAAAALVAAIAVTVADTAGATPARIGRPATTGADTVSGRVVDSSGTPVSGARVELAELGLGTRTDTAGTFAFGGIARGRYTLVVRRLGYAPAVRAVATGTLGEIRLVSQSGLLDPVTVTAARLPLDPLSSPLPVATLGTDGLRREPGVSLAHALEQIPGVRTLSTGEQMGKPVIRGLTGARVLVLDNGNRLDDYSWSNEDGPSVDARLAERVEVIRGPASVLYGSDAVAGAVNVVPEALPDARGGRPFVRGGVEMYAASNNLETGSLVRAEGASGAWGWRAGMIGRRASDLRTPAGELPNTGFAALNGEAAVGVHGERGSATLRYTRYGGEFRLLEAGNATAVRPAGGQGETEGGPVRKTADDRLQFTGTTPLGSTRLELRAQWQRHALQEVGDAGEAGGTSGNGGAAAGETPVFGLTLSTWSADLLAHHALFGERMRGTAGISGIAQRNAAAGPLILVPDAQLQRGAAFAVEELRWTRWSVLAGARLDAGQVRADATPALRRPAQSRSMGTATATLGAVYRLAPDVALTANVARAYRMPTLFELYANGPLLSDQRYIIGDPTLAPETSLGADAGLRWQQQRVRGELTAFRTAVSDFIYLAGLPNAVVAGNALPVYAYYAAPRALLTGGEASLSVDVAAPFTVRGGADYVRSTNRDTRAPIPLTPPLRLRLGGELHTGARGLARAVVLGLDAEHIARQTRLSPAESPTGSAPYTLLHLATGMERTLMGRDARVELRVRNLTNVRYRDFLSRYKEFALNPGRNIILRVALGL